MKSKLINKSQKIYIAGHTGMVGKAILKTFVKNGYENIIYAKRDILDLQNNNDVNIWFKKNKPDIVVIAAAKVGGIIANNTMPTEFLLRNLKIQNNLIENSWHSGVKRLLFLGSSCIYPKFAKQPIKEKHDGLIINGDSKFIGADVDSETDHRVAMSLAIAALLAKGSSKIFRSDASNVSYPGFWKDLESLL